MSAMSDGKEKSSEIHLFDIPWEDVLVPYISPSLSAKDCFNLRCVCQSGKLLGESFLGKINKIVLYPTLVQNRHALQILRKCCKQIKIVTVPQDVDQDSSAQISPKNFSALTSGFKKLYHLNLAYCTNLSPLAIHNVFLNSKYLTFLDLTRCCWLTDGALQTLIINQKNLRNLNLRCCCQLTAQCLIKLIAFCPLLEKLSLEQINSVDDSVLAAIMHHCNNLNSLNLLMCREISSNAIERFLLLKPSVKVEQFGCRSLMCLHPANFALVNYQGVGMSLPVPLGLGFY